MAKPNFIKAYNKLKGKLMWKLSCDWGIPQWLAQPLSKVNSKTLSHPCSVFLLLKNFSPPFFVGCWSWGLNQYHQTFLPSVKGIASSRNTHINISSSKNNERMKKGRGGGEEGTLIQHFLWTRGSTEILVFLLLFLFSRGKEFRYR